MNGLKPAVWRTARIAGAGAIALILTGCASKQAPPPEPVVSVEVATVKKETIQRIVEADALLYPLDQATIVPKISAPVLKFYVQRGSHVHVGQLLAVLENKDLSAAVVENRGAYDQAQATYETSTAVALPEQIQTANLNVQATQQAMHASQLVYQSRLKLFKAGAIARNLMDQSRVTWVQARNQYQLALSHLKALQSVGKQQQLKAAQGQLNAAKGKFLAAQAQYDYSNITSPINGVVTDRPLYEGEMATAGSPLITVMNTSRVVARAHISPQQAAYLHAGDPAAISLGPDLADVTGKVTVISPALDPSSTTVQVWVEANNPDGKLKVGSIVTVSMIAETIHGVLVAPLVALLTAPDGTTSVMVVGPDSAAHQVGVKTGVRQDGEVEITSGLREGQRVVTVGAYGLADGTKVKF